MEEQWNHSYLTFMHLLQRKVKALLLVNMRLINMQLCETNVIALYGIGRHEIVLLFLWRGSRFRGFGSRGKRVETLNPEEAGKLRNDNETDFGHMADRTKLRFCRPPSPPSKPFVLGFCSRADYRHPPFAHGPSALIWLITLPQLDDFVLVCSQIWLNRSRDDRHLFYIF